MEKRPLFSICHTTARPEGWQQSFGAWCGRETGQSRAEYLGGLEYILCIDRRWGFASEMAQEFKAFAASQYPNVDFKVVWNNGRKCMVDGYAFAAAASTGSILILNSDDMFPPKDWDLDLEMQSCCGPHNHGHVADFVIQVSSGTPADARDLMVLQILSRTRYERLGYVLYPGYESMFADDDFSEHARHDGVVIDARHLVFEHRHPALNDSVDGVYKHQNKSQARTAGLSLLQKRRENGFTDVQPSRPKVIATMCPGENFSARWMWARLRLQGEMLLHGFGTADFGGHTSNVYVTRQMLLNALLPDLQNFDYVLWLDDDNVVNWDHVAKLIEDLEAYPSISMVAGWSYIQDAPEDLDQIPEIKASAGMWVDSRFQPLSIDELETENRLLEIDCSGFPCVLMRREALELVADAQPFLPRLGPQYVWGMTGEDMSFCLALKERGGRIFVDPRVRVHHMKIQPVRKMPKQPVTILPEAGELETERTITAV